MSSSVNAVLHYVVCTHKSIAPGEVDGKNFAQDAPLRNSSVKLKTEKKEGT
jgi:hypothetical protein